MPDVPNSLSDTNFQEDDLSRRSVQTTVPETRALLAQQVRPIFETYFSDSAHTWLTTREWLNFDFVPYADIGSLHLSFTLDAPENVHLAIFDAIQRLYLSQHKPRDRRVAERLKTLYRDALAEGEKMQAASVRQFADFFIAHATLGLPKITLTPDGTLRVRWIAGPGNFTAIGFTGTSLVKLVAEIPRDSATAQYFASELISNVVGVARDLGASFT
jgi:hypothetical protein